MKEVYIDYYSYSEQRLPELMEALQNIEKAVQDNYAAFAAMMKPDSDTMALQYQFFDDSQYPLSDPITLNFKDCTSSIGSLTPNEDQSCYEFLVASEDVPFTDDFICASNPPAIHLAQTDGTTDDITAQRNVPAVKSHTNYEMVSNKRYDFKNSDLSFFLEFKPLTIASEAADDDQSTEATFYFMDASRNAVTRTDYKLDVVNGFTDVGFVKEIPDSCGWYLLEIPLNYLEEAAAADPDALIKYFHIGEVHHSFVLKEQPYYKASTGNEHHAAPPTFASTNINFQSTTG